MRLIRKLIYKSGRFPRRGSIWYSPSLEMQYAFKDFNVFFKKSFEAERARQRKEAEDG